MEETLVERGKSLAALTIFIIVAAFHFLSRYIELNKKKVIFCFNFHIF